MRVLVVEDEVKMARAIRRGLEQEGYAVDVAGGGDDGLHLATENDYDAIVLDVLLPGLDGFAVCEALRTRGRWSGSRGFPCPRRTASNRIAPFPVVAETRHHPPAHR